MKATEFLRESKDKKTIPAAKPRNFVAKNSKMGMGGAGAHKDKKKSVKQGDVKHKGKVFAEEGGEVNVAEMQKKLAELEKRKEILRDAVNKARNITTEIKYDDTVMSIVTQIQALAEKTGISPQEIKWAVNEVTEKANELESAIYSLDDAFTDAYRDIDNQVSDLEYEIDDFQNESRRA